MLFDARTEPRGGWVEVIVLGELDLASAPEFRRQLRRASEAGEPIVIDLSGVSFIDSVGLGLLVGADRRARAAGGSLTLTGPSPRVDALFVETGLSKLLDLRDSYVPSKPAR